MTYIYKYKRVKAGDFTNNWLDKTKFNETKDNIKWKKIVYQDYLAYAPFIRGMSDHLVSITYI